MLERILIATDLTESSRSAVRFGSQVATSFGASVVLLHVLYPSVLPIGSPYYLAARDSGTRDEHARDHAFVELTRLRRELCADVADVELVVPRQRDTASAIHHHAESSGATLIVVGSRSAVGLARLARASVAEHLVRLARCPVLVVPARARCELRAGRILVATDVRSGACERALDLGAAWAARLGARLTFLYAARPQPQALATAGDYGTRALRAARGGGEAMARAAAHGAGTGYAMTSPGEHGGAEADDVAVEVMPTLRAARAIAARAESPDVALVIVANDETSRVLVSLGSSVAERVVRRSPVPVLVAPSYGTAAARAHH